MVRVLFLCKRRLSYGNSYGLINSAQFIVNYLNSIDIDAKLEICQDANEIDRFVTDFNPKFVFIEALWVTPNKLNEIMSLPRHKYRVFVIRLHSRPTFIANEGIAFPWLLGYRNLYLRNLLIAPNNFEFAIDLEKTLQLRTTYLPNIYYPPGYDLENLPRRYGVYKIGCFGSMRPMKNHLTQAIASVKYANDNHLFLEFHINGTRTEQQGDQVLKNLRAFFEGQNGRHILVEHDWLSHKDFIQLIQDFDMGMQISLSETFNIVAADFVANDIPFIGSLQISWLPSRFQVVDPNSTDQIYDRLSYANSFWGKVMKRYSKKGLEKYNDYSKEVWNSFIM